MATVHSLNLGVSQKRRVLVIFAINRFAALDVARKFRPHVVLLDIGLPDFNGCKIVEQLKWEPDFQHTRFIAISALPAQQHRQAALDAGCTDFFPKPIDPKVLEEVLGDASSKP